MSHNEYKNKCTIKTMTGRSNNIFLLSLLFLFTFIWSSLVAQRWIDRDDGLRKFERKVDLRGTWKFSLGDDSGWIYADFDDSDWDQIFVPSPWEDEGYPGYDGYAWYRKNFTLTQNSRSKNLYVRLGFIDDVDEVYINGHFIGFTGSFPPSYFTGHHIERIYKIPDNYLNFNGDNLIAVRIYDKELSGGIIRGQVGIVEMIYSIPLLLSLEGLWKFAPADEAERKEFDYNDTMWNQVLVPATWETQGFKDYDGFAWYRKTFFLPEKFKNQELVLLLGKIDDLDETYVNGKLVGKTGDIDGLSLFVDDEWLEFRGYSLKMEDLRFGAENVIAVRVYDGLVQGGIYEGPIGIASGQAYEKWIRKEKGEKSIFDRLFGD